MAREQLAKLSTFIGLVGSSPTSSAPNQSRTEFILVLGGSGLPRTETQFLVRGALSHNINVLCLFITKQKEIKSILCWLYCKFKKEIKET